MTQPYDSGTHRFPSGRVASPRAHITSCRDLVTVQLSLVDALQLEGASRSRLCVERTARIPKRFQLHQIIDFLQADPKEIMMHHSLWHTIHNSKLVHRVRSQHGQVVCASCFNIFPITHSPTINALSTHTLGYAVTRKYSRSECDQYPLRRTDHTQAVYDQLLSSVHVVGRSFVSVVRCCENFVDKTWRWRCWWRGRCRRPWLRSL